MEVEERFDPEYVMLLESRLNEIVPRNATARSLALILSDIWMATVRSRAAREYMTTNALISDRIIRLLSLKQFKGEAILKTSPEWVLNMGRSFVMAFAALTTSNKDYVRTLLEKHPEFPGMVYTTLSEYGKNDPLVAMWGAGLVANMFYHNDLLEPKEAVVALKKVLCEKTETVPHALFAISVALKTVGSTPKGLEAIHSENVIPILEAKNKMCASGYSGENDVSVALECLLRTNPDKYEGYVTDNGSITCKKCIEKGCVKLKTPQKMFYDKFACECSSHEK